MLWICRGPDGAWMGQSEAGLGTANALLRLRDTGVLYPIGGGGGGGGGPTGSAAATHSGGASTVPWMVFDGKAWREMPFLVCRAASQAEADACKPPTPPKHLSLSIADGPIGAGPASEFAGLYELQEGHVNMQPAWRRVRAIGGGPCESHRSLEGSLWLVRGRNGCWVGQKDSQLSRDAGSLQLAHTGFLSPVEASSGGADGGGGRVVWEEYANKAWRAVPGLRCSLADEADVAAMKVAAANLGSAEEAAAMGKEAGGKGSHDHEHTDISDPHGHDEHAHHGHAHGHADCCGHDHGHDEHGGGQQHEHGHHDHGHDERI